MAKKEIEVILTEPVVSLNANEGDQVKVAPGYARNFLLPQGKAVPAPVMSAYAPIVGMIDDIAKGGYMYVKLLQNLADRAKDASRSKK